MTTGLNFLVAARRCEIEELEQLARTSDLVGVIGRLVHALQRERGLSNGFLGSGGVRFGEPRAEQVAACVQIELDVRAGFDELASDAWHGGGSARLFNRIAWVLPGLDGLPELRRRIAMLELQPADATAAFVKLIAGLLAVVFEAADGATDPDISRLLVAMFNFMHGKEFAGQERAFGAGAFALGHIGGPERQQWLHLIDSQERCFRVFADFASAPLLDLWAHSQSDATLAELERMRRIGARPNGDVLDSELIQPWFDCCTLRIDAMKKVEERLADELRVRCGTKTAQARTDLSAYQHLLDSLVQQSSHSLCAAGAMFFDEAPVGDAEAAGVPFGRQLERSVLEMVQEQAHRLQAISHELETVRASLNERKVIERAKGLLMAHRRMTEEEAHKMLRQTAMNQNRRLIDVAGSVLAMAEYLPLEAGH